MASGLGLDAYASSEGESAERVERVDDDDDDEGFVGPARPPSRLERAPSASEDGSEDEDGFVGPARPTTRELVGGDAARGEDVDSSANDFLASIRDGDDDDDDADADAAERACAPARWLARARTPPEPVRSAKTDETQARANDLFLEARRRGITPHEMMFASRNFRNPGFMEACSSAVRDDAFATGAGFAFDDGAIPEEDFYRALAAEQKLATERHLAERNGISFRSARTPPSQPPPVDARQAAVDVAIAKARVEARIALQNAGMEPPPHT